MQENLPVSEPVILCGLGKIGWRILELLRAAGIPVVVINRDRPADEARLAGSKLIVGDMREPAVLALGGVASARGVLVVTSDDLVNIGSALAVRKLNPTVRIVVRVFNPVLLARLGSAVGNMHALSVSALTAPMLAHSALTGDVLGAFEANGKRKLIAKLVLADDSELIGKTIESVGREFNSLPLASHLESGGNHLLGEVPLDAALKAGDELVMCGPPADLGRLMPAGHGDDLDDLPPGVRWAGRMRRFGRVFWRALREIDIALQICGLLLVIVVSLSTAIYAISGMSDSVPDGLYRTISVIATGADMRADNYHGWQKTFVSFLRIFGALLTAAFTAIVTNYLLRARLGAALEFRRIPEAGHFVVCGLGNLGFRVVQELLKGDERVVVIERSNANPRIGTCRRLGAAVIVAEATMVEVLRQARAATSRAVIAATNDDLANLEIALLARELNPRQRVVVRLGDDVLAETLRQVAEVRLALALPGLAAPAFVAALFGDRVHTLFRIHRRMLAAVDLIVQPNDPCLDGQTLGALAIDYGLIAIDAGDETRRLRPGEPIRVVAFLSSLDRVFGRDPAAAEWAVELVSVPAVTRDHVETLVRLEGGLTEREAAALLDHLPATIKKSLTHGQAEQLKARLER